MKTPWFSLAVSLAACTSAARSIDPSPGPGSGSGSGSGSGVGTEVTGSACTPPSGTFTVEDPSIGPWTGNNYFSAVLQMASAGPSIYSTLITDNGQAVMATARTSPGVWNTSPMTGFDGYWTASEALGTSANCVAFSSATGELQLSCGGTLRTIAPSAWNNVNVIDAGAQELLVYDDAAGVNVQTFDGDVGPAVVIDSSTSEVIAMSSALDALGALHVAAIEASIDQTPARTLVHLSNATGTWTREVVDTYTANPTNSDAVALVTDNAGVTIAYHSDHALQLATRNSDGTFTVTTELAADPGFPDDDVGEGIAVATDCTGTTRVVYQRSLSTDAQPNAGLAYAVLDANGVHDSELLPPYALFAADELPYAPQHQGLSLQFDSTGHPNIAAYMVDDGPWLYFATR
jgi:hypothetical protein